MQYLLCMALGYIFDKFKIIYEVSLKSAYTDIYTHFYKLISYVEINTIKLIIEINKYAIN